MHNKTKAWLALLFICIAWGTTYVAIKICVLVYPAFLLAGTRQFIAGLIILALALIVKGSGDLSFRNMRHQMLVGFLMITVGNGLVSWGEKYIPSGVAALICAMMPVFGVMINLGINKKEKINWLIAIGMGLGFFGVALNFRDSFSDLTNSKYIGGIIATLIATASWALGSILGKRAPDTANPMFNSGLQVFFGGAFLLLISPFADDYSKLNIINTEALWSLVYLITIGSVAAYTAYMYALKELPVGIVMTYAYVNPLVAVLLGWWWLQEPLTWITALSFTGIMLGVYLVNRGYKREKEQAALISTTEKQGVL
jgi:drug/metabolite transporter (DMT)-like permease